MLKDITTKIPEFLNWKIVETLHNLVGSIMVQLKHGLPLDSDICLCSTESQVASL